MIYQTYQAYTDVMAPVRTMAGLTASMMRQSFWWAGPVPWLDSAAAGFEMVARTGLTHKCPPYGIDRVRVDGRDVAVSEDVVDRTPFGTLLRFRKDVAGDQPRGRRGRALRQAAP